MEASHGTWGKHSFRMSENGNLLEMTAGQVVPDIKANGSDGPLSISKTSALSLAITLDAGTVAGQDVEWWVLLQTPAAAPNTWWSWTQATNSWRVGLYPASQGALTSISTPLQVWSGASGLTPGAYIFYLCVDLDRNGVPDTIVFADSVSVTVTN
ncbi:MAG: hypothetical protein AB1634_18535 [Thermodesulfobacteriota bacterium]